jgi:hypothetical protein
MIKKIMRFWTEERSLTTLLVLLVINLFVLGPLIRELERLVLLRDMFFSLVLLAGLMTMTRYKSLQVVFVVFVTLTVIVRWMTVASSARALMGLDACLSLLCMLALTAVVLAQVNREGAVTGHRVRGAVAGYLLLGMSCALAYALIEHLIPGSFQTAAADLRSGQLQSDAFYYFSIVTLTTLGYGDITALHPVARSVVMIEALLGQLYPAILIARLVSLSILSRKKTEKS